MGKYRLRLRRSVAKDLRATPKKDVRRILRRIEALKDDPRPPGSERLAGREYYRIRQGVYRILYEIHDDVLLVVVIKVQHRSEVYR